MMRYDVIRVLDTPAFTFPVKGGRVEGVLATPMLISEGTQRPVEAYKQEDLYGDMARRYPGGLWRVREDAYDQRMGVTPDRYVTVIVEVVDDEVAV